MNEMLVLAVGAAVGGLVQGMSGFAFAMVAMAIWVWGVNPQLAAVMAVFGGLTGQIVSVIRVRRGFHLHLLWPFVLGSAVGIPVGNRLLPLLDPGRFKLVLGGLVIQNFNLVVLASTFASAVYAGRARAEHLPYTAVVGGSLLVPSICGSKIYIGMSPTAFRNGVLWILVFAGATMIVSGLKAVLG